MKSISLGIIITVSVIIVELLLGFGNLSFRININKVKRRRNYLYTGNII